ncbi:uncharacterized protein TNCV_2482851 [Trichonephila clavipes]|uniref:Uncharacterized protein n=1 Tax=Trichonephila clavipes TaxID=2585209 RepID=A0A8X6VZ75_TRICX|nr:uncharacterized protein TNCV_2482851 [Trichonephila clavipes]
MGSRSYQTAFSRISTGHLRCMNFESDKRSFPICPKCNISPFSPQQILQYLGFSCEEAVASSPAVLKLCTDLWTHGSGLVKLDQIGISSTTTLSGISSKGSPKRKCPGVKARISTGSLKSGTRGLELMHASIWRNSRWFFKTQKMCFASFEKMPFD